MQEGASRKGSYIPRYYYYLMTSAISGLTEFSSYSESMAGFDAVSGCLASKYAEMLYEPWEMISYMYAVEDKARNASP